MARRHNKIHWRPYPAFQSQWPGVLYSLIVLYSLSPSRTQNFAHFGFLRAIFLVAGFNSSFPILFCFKLSNVLADSLHSDGSVAPKHFRQFYPDSLFSPSSSPIFASSVPWDGCKILFSIVVIFRPWTDSKFESRHFVPICRPLLTWLPYRSLCGVNLPQNHAWEAKPSLHVRQPVLITWRIAGKVS